VGRGPAGACRGLRPDRQVGPFDREPDRTPVFEPDIDELPAPAGTDASMDLDRLADERVDGQRDRYPLNLLA